MLIRNSQCYSHKCQDTKGQDIMMQQQREKLGYYYISVKDDILKIL